jgi:hypothetical protein
LAAIAYAAHVGTWLPDHSYQQADFAIKTDDAWQVYYGADGSYFWLDNEANLEMQGVTMLLGIARKITHDGGSKSLFGLYAEGGWMEYYVDGDFQTPDVVTAEPVEVFGIGRLRSIGGGILARHTMKNNLRFEGSLRAGNIKNKFHAKNFYFNDKTTLVRYEYSAPYVGAHLGVAYQKDLNEVSRVDFLGRFFWNHIKALNVDISGKDTVTFDATNSNRLRGGLRYTRDTTPRFSWYGGVYADYEFSGKSHAHSEHVDFRTPDLKGFTAVGEVGGIGRFKNHENISIEFGVQGYAGKYQGITGGFRAGVEF